MSDSEYLQSTSSIVLGVKFLKMNYYIFTAGIISTLATIGHFAIGTKDFLKPVLNSEVGDIPKNVMTSLFHYMSGFMVLTSVILLSISMGEPLVFQNTKDVVIMIGIFYGTFAIIQFAIALFSSITLGVVKLFQWIFWLLIALFALIGAY